MRRVLFCAFIFLPAVVFAEELPLRKSGLWEVKTVMQGIPEQVAKHCSDAETDAKMMGAEKGMGSKGEADCKQKEIRKEGSSFIAEVECKMGETKMISKSVFSGDFNSNYQGTVTIKTEPPMMGMGEQTIKMSGKWIGPCEAGQKPGDIIMPGGMKMNILSMGKY
jgi:hypothetical protein